MHIKEHFIVELQSESAGTRKMLATVPLTNPGWQPHEKSTNLKTLGLHIARLPLWIPLILKNDNLDLMVSPFGPYPEINSTEELVAFHDKNIALASEALAAATDEDFEKPIIMKRGEFTFFNNTKDMAIRKMANNHLIHHRGQLSVYLRLLDVPIPGMYGPSADEIAARAAASKN